jgi:aspartyl/glutamyl-tRNA(Asn/Gln) amidotransferase C subunit
MTITQEQIIKIAKKLWKVKSNNEEKLAWNIASVLEYVDLLNEVDTTWVIPTVSVIAWENILKEDTEKRNITPKELLACSPCRIIANQIAIADIMK